MERNIFNRISFVLALVLITFATLAYGAVHQAVLAIVYLLVAALLILWCLDSRRRGELRYSSSPLQLPLAAAAAYGFVQILPFGSLPSEAGIAGIPRTISIEPFATLLSSTHFLALFALFAVLLIQLDSAARIRRIVAYLSIFGFAFAFFSVLQSVLSPDKIYGIYGRPGVSIFGSFVNRNHFAAWMEMAIAFPLGLLFSGAVSKDKRLLFVTAAILMGSSIVVSGSRGGLIAFFAEIIFIALVTFGAKRGRMGLRILLIAGLFGAIIAGAVFVGGETSLSRLSDLQNPAASGQDRSHIWSVTLKVIGDGLPFGTGMGTFGTAYPKFDANSGLERVEQAHNDYLQVLSDTGFPGALIGVSFLVLLVVIGRRTIAVENHFRRAIAVGALAGLVGVLIHSVFDFVLHTSAVAFLFLVLVSILVAVAGGFPDEVPNDETAHKHRRKKRIHEGAIPDLGAPGKVS